MANKNKLEFQKITNAEIIKIFLQVGIHIQSILAGRGFTHTIYFEPDGVIVDLYHKESAKTGGFRISSDELNKLKPGDGIFFLNDRIELGIRCVLGEQTASGEKQKGLLNISKLIQIRAAMTERASKVGPQHAWWDVIFDINAAIDGKPTMSGKNLLELLEYSTNLLDEK